MTDCKFSEGDVGPQVEAALRELPPFSVRIARDGEQWTARGVEYDITAQHETFHGVCEAFAQAFVVQAVVNMHHGKEPMADVPPAPGGWVTASGGSCRSLVATAPTVRGRVRS